MLDVMLDLETMGNGPQAAIIAIGAVEFDLSTGRVGEKFYTTVNLSSSVMCGGVIDADTVIWWMKQSDVARNAVCQEGSRIIPALLQFNTWMEARGDTELVRVWGNGAAFDNVILSSAYQNTEIRQPWKFWNDRCYRTIKAQHPDVPIDRVGTHHHAGDDAETQAKHLIKMLIKS